MNSSCNLVTDTRINYGRSVPPWGDSPSLRSYYFVVWGRVQQYAATAASTGRLCARGGDSHCHHSTGRSAAISDHSGDSAQPIHWVNHVDDRGLASRGYNHAIRSIVHFREWAGAGNCIPTCCFSDHPDWDYNPQRYWNERNNHAHRILLFDSHAGCSLQNPSLANFHCAHASVERNGSDFGYCYSRILSAVGRQCHGPPKQLSGKHRYSARFPHTYESTLLLDKRD